MIKIKERKLIIYWLEAQNLIFLINHETKQPDQKVFSVRLLLLLGVG